MSTEKITPAEKKMSFEEWVEYCFYEGFDLSGLTDEEYYELEDIYYDLERRFGNDA